MIDAVIVQAAVTGSLVDRSTNPNVPITTEEIVQSSLDAWRAALTDYAARMGRGQIVERCWTITEAQASRAGNPASRHR